MVINKGQMTLKKTFTLMAALILTANLASAQETPLWLRKNQISPDGTQVAFCYKGDIYVVSINGGKAVQVTSNPSYDSDPFWTADSKKIVFSSDREHGKDIYITSAQGGTPERLTDFAGSETPLAVLPDGNVIYSANNNDIIAGEYGDFPGRGQLFETSTDTLSRPKVVTSLPIMAMSVSNDGTVLYEDWKGYEDTFRKHHTSSVTRDIWMYKGTAGDHFTIDGKGTFKKLTSFTGEDRNPVFASDGNTYYYLSEQDGKTSNIYKSSLSAPDKSIQLTFETQNPVRYLSVSKNGTMTFSYNGELFKMTEGGKPEKIDITVVRDEDERDIEYLTLSAGASSMEVSPDGKEVAVVLRGDVFVTSSEYKTTKRITNTPEQERDVSWSKDGRELYYSAERNGCWSIYKTVLTDKDDKGFTYSVKMKEEMVSKPGETCFQPDVSPDGKWVAYLRDRTELVIQDTKSGNQKSLLKGVNYSYQDGDQDFQWSPDSRFLLCNYQGDGGWNNEDVALIEIETGKITDLTQSGYSDNDFKWALKGKAMTWESDKNGYRSHGSWGAEDDVYIMFFDGKRMAEFSRDKEDEEIAKQLSGEDEAKAKKDSTKAEKKVEKLDLDLDNRADRIVRLTRFSGMMGDHYLTQDGKKLYYIERLEKSSDLCVLDIQDKSVTVLKKSVMGQIYPSPDDKYIYIFSGAGISKITIASGKSDSITFSGEYEFKPKAERTYMFNHIWKQMKEKFYDPDMHGVDWAFYKQNYERFLPYISNNTDFAEMLSEMLGELNGSHTGARSYSMGGFGTGYLGVIYDNDYQGDGLMIKEVLPGGAMVQYYPQVKEGDIITAIDGHEIKAGEDWYPLLTNKAGKKIAVSIKSGHKSDEFYMEPSSSDDGPLYKRWVKQREEMVTKLSGGKIGYVHIQGMDSPSYRELYSKALGKYRNCEALIVDTRHNGGGWLHDDLVTFLGGKTYYTYTPRGQYIGEEPFSKWTKPSCVLVGEDNYSDASGFPYAYQMLREGKLIGAPVPGTMTAVWWERQINASIVFGIPQVGNWSVKDGRYVENHQIEPDILVYNDPGSVLNGEDKQLEAAVKEMLQEIEKKK
jgi:tricorn protease